MIICLGTFCQNSYVLCLFFLSFFFTKMSYVLCDIIYIFFSNPLLNFFHRKYFVKIQNLLKKWIILSGGIISKIHLMDYFKRWYYFKNTSNAVHWMKTGMPWTVWYNRSVQGFQLIFFLLESLLGSAAIDLRQQN